MLKIFGTLVCLKFYIKNFILVCDWQTFVRERRTFVRERRTCPRRTLSAGGRLSAEYYFDEDFFSKNFCGLCPRRTTVRGG